MAKLIGTAGHVDHGKTTLIQALTGIDADRLPEEKRRGMTIDIGFAYIDLPEVGRVSIVDVPGHEKFLSNMLVGALAIDVALLCVAADEAVMPQTREHLQILELLPVEKLVVAMTRADLADEETRELAKLEIEELVQGSRFAGAPILAVSAVTGEGLQELRSALAAALSQSDPATENAPWYLPIDRAFNVKGHGCVVTGTVAQGEVKLGDAAFLEPGHVEVRVRGIHTHDEPVEASERGKRTALNLSGVKLEDVHRGQSLGAPGALFESSVIDARLKWIAEPKHGLRVRVSIGAEEAIGKLFLNDHDPDLAQFRLEQPVAVALNQPLIVRRYSPPDLIAGGRVVVPQARVRRKGEELQLTTAGSDADAILEVVGEQPNGVNTEEVCRLLGKTPQALGTTFEKLLQSEALLGFAGTWLSPAGWESGKASFLSALQRLHEQNPTTSLHPRERVVHTAGLAWAGKPLDRIIARLQQEGAIEANGTNIRAAGFKLALTPRQRQFLDRVVAEISREPVNTPHVGDLAKLLAVPHQAVDEILRLGIQAGEILQIADQVYYTPGQLEALKERVRQASGGKPFSAAEARDALGTTRKYIIPLLEYFDRIRFTTRLGDNRVIQ